MMNKQQIYKSPSQFLKGGKNKPPKSPQGKPGKKTKLSKAPKKGKKTGSQMLGSAMKKLSKSC